MEVQWNMVVTFSPVEVEADIERMSQLLEAIILERSKNSEKFAAYSTVSIVDS